MRFFTLKSIIAFSVFCFTLSLSLCADEDLAGLFKNRNINGTLIVSSLSGDEEFIHNVDRANARFIPASTFKIINTLIALDEGAITTDEVIRWDGEDRGWKSWNQDHSIKTAFPVSCVWFYQELARRVGLDKYITRLSAISYGNMLTGLDVSNFWLEGDVRISAKEQIDLLKKIYEEALPYKKEHFQVLKTIMKVKESENYIIRAKTGWATNTAPGIGWHVGYVEKIDNIWFFALNIDIANKSDLVHRKEIVYEALEAKGIVN